MPETDPGRTSAGRWQAGRVLGYAVGILLLAAAVIAVTARTDALETAIESARRASPWLIVGVILLPLANIAVISASFWVLTSRHGRVGFLEMVALIVSSWLLNHLPMRPGLVGRVGYQRMVCGVSIKNSVRVVVEQLLCGVAALALVVGVVLVLANRGLWTNFVVLMFVGGIVAAAGLCARRAGRAGAYIAALGFRVLDMTLWLARYGCLFAISGSLLDARGAAAVTVAAQGAMLSPVPVGLREWAVGVAHGLFGGSLMNGGRGDVVAGITPGVAADLVNRAAELVVCVPLGILTSIWLARRVRRNSAQTRSPATHPEAGSSV